MHHLDPAARDYIRAFNLVAIAIYPGGRIHLTRDPRNVVAAWWCDASKAGRVLQLSRLGRVSIEEAARQLGVQLGTHGQVMTRSMAAVARIDDGLLEAAEAGQLRHFNRTYRERREAARERGHGFMTYAQARRRLRTALAEAAAGRLTVGIVERVFGGPGS